MPNKNAKHSQPKAPAEPLRAEWRVIHSGNSNRVPLSSVRRNPDGSCSFSDEAGTVAEFPPGAIVLREPPREPVKVTLPARFVTQPAAVREFQDALTAATGVQVILLPPSSKAADAVSEPE